MKIQWKFAWIWIKPQQILTAQPPLLQYDTNIIMGFKKNNPNQPGVNESVGKILVDVIEEKTVETNRHHFTMYKANVKAFECKPTEMGILEYGQAAHMFLDTPTLLLDVRKINFNFNSLLE